MKNKTYFPKNLCFIFKVTNLLLTFVDLNCEYIISGNSSFQDNGMFIYFSFLICSWTHRENELMDWYKSSELLAWFNQTSIKYSIKNLRWQNQWFIFTLFSFGIMRKEIPPNKRSICSDVNSRIRKKNTENRLIFHEACIGIGMNQKKEKIIVNIFKMGMFQFA